MKQPVIVLFLLILFLLFCIGHFFCTGSHCNLDYSKSIDPVNLLGLLLTIIITIWIGWYVAKRFSEQRFIKEFVVSDIRKIEDHLSELERLLRAKSIETSVVFELMTILKNKIGILKSTLEFAKITDVPIDKVVTIHLDIYNMSTNSDGKTINLSDLSVQIDLKLKELTIQLRQIICDINKV